MARSIYANRQFTLPQLRLTWLVTIALIPQFLAFYISYTSRLFSKEWASSALIGSQLGLLGFAWANRKEKAFWVMGVGLAMNLLVIVLNGGLMPISPDTIRTLAPHLPADAWQIGSRLGQSKDVVLPAAETRLWWLSDRFVTPPWFPRAVAFSLGDVVVALGVFWLLWEGGSARSP